MSKKVKHLFTEQGEIMPDRLYTDIELALILGYASRAYILQLRCNNKPLPRWVKFGRNVRTPGSEIKKFVEERLIQRSSS